MIKVYKKLLTDGRIWLACSGGIDSLACAHFLKTKIKLNIFLWHFNHNCSTQNAEMQKSVEKFGEKFAMPVYSLLRKEHGQNSEAVLREARISALKKCKFINNIILCHHLDDCVESYLMNCFNGVPQYCPIPIRSKYGHINVIRPFMTTTKKDFKNYAKRNNLDDFIVEDKTNTDIKYKRNWIRHECRPKIEEMYPGIKKIVLKKMHNYYLGI